MSLAPRLKSRPTFRSTTTMSSPRVSRSATLLSLSSGAGLHELSVMIMSENLTPTLDAMRVSSGTHSSLSSREVEYTTAPPYPSHASFVPR